MERQWRSTDCQKTINKPCVNRAAGEHEGKRSVAAVVNDMPVACQSRSVTEPQREKARLVFQ